MKNNGVFITAFSAISALGIGNTQSYKSLKSGIVPIVNPKESNKFLKPYFEIDYSFNNQNISKSSKIVLKLISLIEEKLDSINNIPIFLATSTGGIAETEEVYSNLINDKTNYPLFKKHFFDVVINDIKDKYTNKFSKSFSFSTACSSSLHSILQAFKFIKNGIIDKALVIGYDTLSYTTMVGFDSLKLVSSTGIRPLSSTRDGLSLGEGGGILLLENDNACNEPICEILGANSNSDGYHISSPDPDGSQQINCIQEALKEADISASDIDYINAHGTGTIMNDQVEMKAIENIFPKNTLTTSLKAFIGHTLGASAITEIAIAIKMLQENSIIQPFDFTNSINSDYVPNKSVSKKVKYFQKNSFGFGGNNASVVIKNLF